MAQTHDDLSNILDTKEETFKQKLCKLVGVNLNRRYLIIALSIIGALTVL